MPYLRAGLMPHEPFKVPSDIWEDASHRRLLKKYPKDLWPSYVSGVRLAEKHCAMNDEELDILEAAYKFISLDDRNTDAELKALGLWE